MTFGGRFMYVAVPEKVSLNQKYSNCEVNYNGLTSFMWTFVVFDRKYCYNDAKPNLFYSDLAMVDFFVQKLLKAVVQNFSH